MKLLCNARPASDSRFVEKSRKKRGIRETMFELQTQTEKNYAEDESYLEGLNEAMEHYERYH